MTSRKSPTKGNKEKLDEKKPYAVVRGAPQPKERYLQEGKYFDAHKVYCGQAPAGFQPAKAKAPKPAGPSKPLTAREKALLSLGDIDVVPASIKEARQENRRAAAAEENAD